MLYTQKEIESKIHQLEVMLESKKLQRTAISKDITSLRKQIEKWRELDMSQTKLF